MDLVDIAFLFVPLTPWVALYCIVRYGPFPNRWWRGENVVGFTFLVGSVCFSLGFFGPMILAPGSLQGPLLGILYTGPYGMLLGVAWGLLRARKRQTAAATPNSPL